MPVVMNDSSFFKLCRAWSTKANVLGPGIVYNISGCKYYCSGLPEENNEEYRCNNKINEEVEQINITTTETSLSFYLFYF